LEETVALERQFINRADDEAVPGIKIGKTTVSTKVVAVLYNRALVRAGVVIDRFRERVRGVERQAARKSFLGCKPEAVVVRVAAAFPLCDVRKSGIWRDGTACRKTHEGAYAVHKLIYIAGDLEVRSLRAVVPDRDGNSAFDLALNIQV